MLFRRARSEKLKVVAPDPEADPAEAAGAETVSAPVEKTQHAPEAIIRLALSVDRPGFHLFVAGQPGSGRRAAVKTVAAAIDKAERPTSDWVCADAPSFQSALIALRLPAGTAKAFASGLARALAETEAALRDLATSKGFQNRRRLIEERFRHATEDGFQLLQERAEAQNLMLLTTPNGYAFAPVHEGRVVRPEVFQALPDALRAAVEEKIHGFETELQAVLLGQSNADTVLQAEYSAFWRDAARTVVEQGFAPLTAAFDASADASAYITSLLDHIVAEPRREQADLSQFRAHVMTEAAPDVPGIAVTEALDPSLATLFGSGSPAPLATLTPGAVHRANGGVLLLDAARLLKSDGAWSALAAALETGCARHPASAQGLPLTLKLVVVGSEDDFRRLCRDAPGFTDHVRLIATISPEPLQARDCRSLAQTHSTRIIEAGNFLKLEKAAVNALDKHLAALSEASRTERHLENLIAAADHLARAAARKEVAADDIAAAIAIDAKRAEILDTPDLKGQQP